MTEIDWQPQRSKLRSFSFLLAGLCLIVAVERVWRSGLLSSSPTTLTGSWRVPIALLVIAAAAAAVGALAPTAMRVVYVGMMVLTYPLSWVVSNVLLSVTYYGVFTPFAFAFRIMGRDSLQRQVDRTAPTYWQPRASEPSTESYFRQY
jgi:hypothetical protein